MRLLLFSYSTTIFLLSLLLGSHDSCHGFVIVTPINGGRGWTWTTTKTSNCRTTQTNPTAVSTTRRTTRRSIPPLLLSFSGRRCNSVERIRQRRRRDRRRDFICEEDDEEREGLLYSISFSRLARTIMTTTLLYSTQEDVEVEGERDYSQEESKIDSRSPLPKQIDDDDDDDSKIELNKNDEATTTSPLTTTQSSSVDDDIPPIPSIPLSYLAISVIFVMFWPLLALLRAENYYYGNPLAGFDVDMYMALKGIFDSNNSMDMIDMDQSTIMELPPLSIGERLVDAIFGP